MQYIDIEAEHSGSDSEPEIKEPERKKQKKDKRATRYRTWQWTDNQPGLVDHDAINPAKVTYQVYQLERAPGVELQDSIFNIWMANQDAGVDPDCFVEGLHYQGTRSLTVNRSFRNDDIQTSAELRGSTETEAWLPY